MDTKEQCSVEGCTDAVHGYARFIDAIPEDQCQGHLGWGLILRVGFCAAHLKFALKKGADAPHWSK